MLQTQLFMNLAVVMNAERDTNFTILFSKMWLLLEI